MNKYFILLLLMCFAHSIMGQTENTVLQGRTGPQISTVFPLVNDSTLKKNKYSVIYPLLVVNNVIISDTAQLNCFRNHFDRTKITKIKSVTAEKAEKMGIPNVPKDGVLFVTAKKDYYFDFSCE
jgi:hypothetical protein